MNTTVHNVGLWPTAITTRRVLICVESLVALNAYGGAWWGLAGAKDVPPEFLEGTPFDSYVVPSLFLLVGIGGGMTVAAVTLLLRRRHAAELSVAAGLVLILWITAQVALIVPNGGFSWLQPTMFAAGLLVTGLGWRLRRMGPRDDS